MKKEEIMKYENIVIFNDGDDVKIKPPSKGFIVGYDEATKEGDITVFLVTNAIKDVVEDSVKVVSYLNDLDMSKTLVITNGDNKNFDYSFDKFNMYFSFIENYKHFNVSIGEEPEELFDLFYSLVKIEKEYHDKLKR